MAASAALAGPALAATTYTWTGANTGSSGIPSAWSAAANWDGNGVPSSSLTGTSLAFPALSSTACTSSPPTEPCYASTDDLGALSVSSLAIDDGLGYSLAAAGPSDTITLGAGGLTAAPSASDTGVANGANIDVPITLGANQSWSITGGANDQQLQLEAPVTGSGYTLGIALNDQTFLGVTANDEVGAVTFTASGSPGALALGDGTSPGTLNGTDGNPVTMDGGTGLFAYPGETGPLSVNGGTVQVGEGMTNAGASMLTVEGAVTLNSTSTLRLSINDSSGTAAGTDYAQLAATGDVALGGATLALTNFSTCPAPAVGQVYTLVHTTGGTITGTFSGLPGGTDFQLQCSPGTAPTFEIGYTTTSVTATVVPAATNSTTSLSSAPADPVTNQPVTLTATVTPATSSPSGTVEFEDGGVPISGCTSQPVTQTGPSSYTATCTASFTAAGSPLSLTATFTSASPALTGSTSAADTLTVGPAATTTALQASTVSPQAGQTVTYTATVTPGESGPVAASGTVEFIDGGTAVSGCAAQPVADGVATCSVTYNSSGTHTITAHYQGDANFDGSTSAAVTVTASAPASSGAGSGSTGAGSVAGTAGVPRVVGTTVAEMLRCSGSSSQRCTFKVALTVVETLRGGRLVGVSARAARKRIRVRKKIVTVGVKTVSVAGGSSVTVRLGLNRSGLHLLRERRSLHVKLSISAAGRTVRHQTIQFRQKAKRRK